MAEKNDMKKTVAVYRELEFGYMAVFCKMGDRDPGLDSYVRISEFVDIEFPPLTSDETIQNAVATLDLKRAKVTGEFTKKLAEIDRRKAELLALPAPAKAQESS